MNLPDLASAAAGLARQGIPVFPCHADKSPATQHGFKNATCDPHVAARIFRATRNAALIGVPTGLASGLTVVDVDPNGFQWLANNLRRLPKTRIHETRRGYHLVFKTPTPPIPNSAGLLGFGVDIRGEGGFIVWWPAELPISNPAEPADLPAWIPARLKRMVAKRDQAHAERLLVGNSGSSPKAVENLLRFVSRQRPGQRNAVTFWAGCRFGESGLANAEADLIRAAMATGLDIVEATRTVRSGIARGARDGKRGR